MRISDWSSDVCSSDLFALFALYHPLSVVLTLRGADHRHLQRRPTFDHESVRNGAKLSQTAQPTIEVTGDDGPGLRWLFDILVHDRAEAARGAARPQDHERQTLTELAAVPDPAACRFALPGASRRIAADRKSTRLNSSH